MRLKGEAYSKRLEAFSLSTIELMSQLLASTREAALKLSDITTDSELTEEQVVERLKKLLEETKANS